MDRMSPFAMLGPPSEPIERRRLSDDIRARCEAMIASGEFGPGDALPSERALMQRFGVGRPAIREALFALQRMGLVTLAGGVRARVTTPSADRIIFELSGTARYILATEEGERAFQHARLLFEVGLAREAARSASEEDLKELRKALAANKEAMHDIDAFQRTDIAFHLRLALMSKNPLVKSIHDAIETWLARQRKVSLMIPGALRTAYRFHNEIYLAIAAGDPDRAEAAMREHLESVAGYYWQSKRGKAPVASRMRRTEVAIRKRSR